MCASLVSISEPDLSLTYCSRLLRSIAPRPRSRCALVTEARKPYCSVITPITSLSEETTSSISCNTIWRKVSTAAVSNGLTIDTMSFPSRTATGIILCLRANGREILASIISTSSLSGSILKKCRCASSAIRRARRKSSMRVPLPLASVRFIPASALNGLASSSARDFDFADVRNCLSVFSTSARCFSSMKPALKRRSPR